MALSPGTRLGDLCGDGIGAEGGAGFTRHDQRMAHGPAISLDFNSEHGEIITQLRRTVPTQDRLDE